MERIKENELEIIKYKVKNMLNKKEEYIENDYYLYPIYSTQKSYYKKAKVVITNEYNKILISYNTVIAIANNKGYKVVCDYKDLSRTTLKHLKEFLLQANKEYPTLSKIKLNEFIYQ